jgi:molybdopterin molybdotransferase
VAAVPGFDHSAVDGYAVRLADLPDDGPLTGQVTLAVTGAVRAGDGAGAGLGPAQAVRIMTGAPLPAGADAVVPVELTSTRRFGPGHAPDESTVSLARPRKDNIRRRGEDIRAGFTLARPGSPVTPALIAAAAAAGVTHLSVVAADATVGPDQARGAEQARGSGPAAGPRVAVISTGSELRPAGQALGAGQIVDSNSLMVAAIVRAAGGEPVRLSGVADDTSSLRAALDAVCDDVDLVVSTGGVSAGAFDVVRQVLTSADCQDGAVTDADLTGVAQRPGRPQGLARWRGVPWIALPGTPTAAFVSAHLYVTPSVVALRATRALRAGTTPAPSPSPDWRRLGPSPLWGRRAGDTPRTHVVPVRSVDDVVVPTSDAPGCGHAMTALLAADGLALVTPGSGTGSRVEVVRL